MKYYLDQVLLVFFFMMAISVMAVTLSNLRDYYSILSDNWKALLVLNVLLYAFHIFAYLALSYHYQSIYFSHHKLNFIHGGMFIFTFVVSITMTMLKGYDGLNMDMYYFLNVWNWIYTFIQAVHILLHAHNISIDRHGGDSVKAAKVSEVEIPETEPVPELPVHKRAAKHSLGATKPTLTEDIGVQKQAIKNLLKEIVLESQPPAQQASAEVI